MARVCVPKRIGPDKKVRQTIRKAHVSPNKTAGAPARGSRQESSQPKPISTGTVCAPPQRQQHLPTLSLSQRQRLAVRGEFLRGGLAGVQGCRAIALCPAGLMLRGAVPAACWRAVPALRVLEGLEGGQGHARSFRGQSWP